MPLNDYNKKKDLEVTTQNDSGTTQDKAQPISIIGEVTPKEFDGFEDGDFSSNPTWTETATNGTATVQSTTVKNGSNALEISTDGSGSHTLQHDRGTSDSISDGDQYQFWIRTNNSSEGGFVGLSNTSGDLTGNDSIRAGFNGAGDFFVQTRDGTGTVLENITLGSFNADTWYLVSFTFNNSNSKAALEIYDTSENLVESQYNLEISGASNIQYVLLENGDFVGGESIFFDDVSYSTTESGVTTIGEDKTGNGYIVTDFTNIAGPEDIALYDQNGNLLDYEIESLDTTAETGVIWCYNSWTRDDSVQAQIAYGDNSANTDRQNVTGTWNNTGQNAWGVMHQATGALGFDSAQNITRTVTGVTETTGQFDGGGSYDGSDDEISFQGDQETGDTTLKCWFKQSTNTDVDTILRVSGSNDDVFRINGQSDGTVNTNCFDSSTGSNDVSPKSGLVDDGQWHQAVAVIRANNEIEMFVDGESVGAKSTGNNLDLSGEKSGRPSRIGSNNSDRFFKGGLDEAALHTDAKDAAWVQADYDASPKAGQVYFSQQAAEPTGPKTVSAPTTTVTVSNPEPQVNPQTATIQAPETTVAVNNPEPQVQGTGSTSVNAQTTTLTVSNPEPTISSSLIIQAPTTKVSVANPEPNVQGTGTTDIKADPTQITVSNPEPDVQGIGTVDVQAPETNVAVNNPEPQIKPSATATIQAPETSLTVFNPAPQMLLGDINVLQPTFALLTNTNRFVDMEQQTFKKNDFSDAVTATLKDENGAIDLSNAVQEVRLLIQTTDGTQKLDEKVSITDAVNGEVRYKWSKGDPIEEVDVYRAEFEIIDGSGDSETVPNNDYISLTVQEDLT